MKYTIAIIVVTYNRKELLKECLNNILNSSYLYFDIFVIDNHSTDGTQEELSNYWANEKINYYNTGMNMGGAGGFYYGLKNCSIQSYDYVLLMDDDTMIKKDTLYNFMCFLQKKRDIGFVTGKVLWRDGNICKMNIPKITKWKRISKFEKTQRVQYASFVSLLIRADVIKKLGLPYRDFFIWGDDWEYTRRISKQYKCIYYPKAESVHMCANNVGASIVECEPDRIERFQYMYRNDVVLYRLDGLEGYIYLLLRTAFYTIKILLKANEKQKKLKLMYSSLRKGFKFNPKIDYLEIE